MTENHEFLAGMAKRLRELQLFLGYETAASFARAIGYPPDKYSRYERQGFSDSGTLIQFVKAVENAGLGSIDIDWLVDFGQKWRVPPAKQTRQPLRVEGSVVHANFAR